MRNLSLVTIAVLLQQSKTFRCCGDVERVVICAIHLFSVIISTNLINLQTLIHFNISIGVMLQHSDMRLKHIVVMFILSVCNEYGVNDVHNFVLCDGKIYTWLNKP
jgi:hypothetical protein